MKEEKERKYNLKAILANSAKMANKLGFISKSEMDNEINNLFPKKRIRKEPFISR